MFWFLKIVLLWTLECVYLFELEFSLEICPGVRLQDRVIQSFYFSSVLIIALWGILSLSDNSNISVISVLACNDFLFSFKLRFFLAPMVSGFQLKPGHFGYYAVRIWILLKTYILAGLFWDWSCNKRRWRGGGAGRWWAGGGHSTSPARQRWKFRTCTWPLLTPEGRGAPFTAGLAWESQHH